MTDVRSSPLSTLCLVMNLEEKVKGVTPLRLSIPDICLTKGLARPGAITLAFAIIR